MKRLRHVTILLFGGVLAACALAAPPMASAASWGPLGSTHVLTSSNLRFDAHVPNVGIGGVFCTGSQLHAEVRDGLNLIVTGASFGTCHGTGVATNCTPTMRATSLPWNVTGLTTSNVTIDGMRFDIHFETSPGAPASCIAPSPVTLTGTLGSGTWIAPTHVVSFVNATGLTAHIPGFGPAVTTTSGTFRDISQTLTLT
jgi:hypothetical protein